MRLRRSFPAIGWAMLVASAAASAADMPMGDAQSHRSEQGDRATRRSEASYTIPAVALVRDDGKPVSLSAEINDGRPVVLNFVYTSCETICPLSSKVFSEFQARLAAGTRPVHLVSLSIDPEQDTPARLKDYARQFNAQPGWDMYTGTFKATTAVLKAFGAYDGSKMNHTPITFLREAPGKPWVRIDGFATADDLQAESRRWTQPALVAR